MQDFPAIRRWFALSIATRIRPTRIWEGLNTTFQKMKEFGLKDPVISEEGNYLKVVLPHLPLAAPTVAIMDFLRTHKEITNRHARDITGIKSENLVKIEFYKLRDEGHIERVPDKAGPKSAWRLTTKGKRYLANTPKNGAIDG
jgi:ATP-dependent DNA helicase RecG